jgi:hypothetical protein
MAVLHGNQNAATFATLISYFEKPLTRLFGPGQWIGESSAWSEEALGVSCPDGYSGSVFWQKETRRGKEIPIYTQFHPLLQLATGY